MDRTNYIIRQLGRTKNKRYELYCVTRIIHLLNNLDVKFVTQQYVSRPDGFALMDLYFPQIQLHVEVDEEGHKSQVEADKMRESDIVAVTDKQIEHIDASKNISITEINDRIDEIVAKINAKIVELKDDFIPWDIKTEFNPQTYIDLGYIKLSDNVAFKTIKDVCNCFGHNYKGWQRAEASHPDKDTIIWCPKLFLDGQKQEGEWDNTISADGQTITEKNSASKEKAEEHVNIHINNKEKAHKRIVFIKIKDNLGVILYRFRGLYKLNLMKSNVTHGLIWERAKTEIPTYKHLKVR